MTTNWRDALPRRLLPASLAALALGLAPPAGAGEGDSVVATTRREALALSGRASLVEHPFAFVVDPGTPGLGGVAVGQAIGLASGIAPDRPLPTTLAAAGPSNTVGATFGLGERIAPWVTAVILDDRRPGTVAAAAAGVTLQLTRPIAPLRASISAGGLHEGSTGASGATLLAAASLDQGPLRLAGNLRGERIFATGRDRLDVVAVLGGSVRVAGGVRLGGEYVGQDLEEALSPGAEGGALHAVGPDAAFELEGGRYQITVAALFGATPASPRALVRAALSVDY